MMDWDAFRYFRVIAQKGSVRGAAQALGVNPSTVTRRLESLETDLGVHLFTRSQSGLQITTEGVEVAQRTDQIARLFGLLESSLKGRDQRLEGQIRVVVPDALGQQLLFDELAAFAGMYPATRLEVLPEKAPLDAYGSGADVTLQITDDPPEMMVGRRVLPLGLAAYATPDFVQQRQRDLPDSALPWIEGLSDGELQRVLASLRNQYFPSAVVRAGLDELSMQQAALRAGLGAGILPCLQGEPDNALVRLPQMPIQAGPHVWLLTHPEQRSVRRVQVFLEFLRATLMRHEQAFLPVEAS